MLLFVIDERVHGKVIHIKKLVIIEFSYRNRVINAPPMLQPLSWSTAAPMFDSAWEKKKSWRWCEIVIKFPPKVCFSSNRRLSGLSHSTMYILRTA